ncbi:putative lpxtg-domain-containing protein [Diaporthe ampelina]|uniref:Putative lpxtg-domain-containing protein n=1 Tax=Diaporthe ampelina TaxID=1214573 RepID=A0A0G2HKI8_9PEZI|nr:putative lpxtg-domain-containing protein [Diaporthe ampelina]
MRPTTARLVVSTALVSSAAAILVTPDSPCDSQCGNVLSATTGGDIECDQNNYGNAAGTVFRNCMNCELGSKYYSAELNQSDQQWMLYNSRFAVSYCVFGDPGNENIGDTPCVTSRACGVLKDAIQFGNFSTNVGAYDYCQHWDFSDLTNGCEQCLRADEDNYLANMVALLQIGCSQKPVPGATVAVEGDIFSNTLLQEGTPTPINSWTGDTNSGPLSLGAKVGIAIGGLCLALVVAGFCIVCNGRRRRRAYLRKLEMRQKDAGWPHHGGGGGGGSSSGGGGGGVVVNRGPDMNETPLSQKPLRGWDDSPLSATASASSYGRYFSPYSSQYNSPVSAAGTPAIMAQQWPQSFHDHLSPQGYHDPGHGFGVQGQGQHEFPSPAQDKAFQDQHEAETAAGPSSHQPIHIGVALGGDEPSLRTEPSNPSFRDHHDQGGAAAAAAEEYELHEVSSAGGSSAGGANAPMMGHSDSFKNRLARGNVAPVLQHPGYGRYSPDKFPPPPPPTQGMQDG